MMVEIRFQILRVGGSLRLFAKPPTIEEAINDLLSSTFGFTLPEVTGLMSNLVLDGGHLKKWSDMVYPYIWEGPYRGKNSFPEYYFFSTNNGQLLPHPSQDAPILSVGNYLKEQQALSPGRTDASQGVNAEKWLELRVCLINPITKEGVYKPREAKPIDCITVDLHDLGFLFFNGLLEGIDTLLTRYGLLPED